jgi:hypothetical protein
LTAAAANPDASAVHATLGEHADVPGFDIVSSGLVDLSANVMSVNALLVAVAAPRLRSDGLVLPDLLPELAKDRLWDMLQEESGDDAHRRYNALMGRVLSFASAYETRQTAKRDRAHASTG